MLERLIRNLDLIFRKSHTPRWIVFLIDLLVCLFSISFAYLLRFNFEIPQHYLETLYFVLPYVLFIRALSFVIFRSYAGLIRYTSAKDTERIMVVIMFGTAIFIIVNLITYQFILNRNLIPFGIVIIDFLITAFIMTFSRLFIKTLYLEIHNPSSEKSNVIIYGANQLGAITKRTLDRDTGLKNRVVAFIDAKSESGNKLEGITIYSDDDLPKLLKKFNASKLIFAKKDVDPLKKSKIIDECFNEDVKVLTVPDVNNWINGDFSVNQLREMKIEDLLERSPIKLEESKIKENVLNKIILVTGAAGSIGSELVRQLSKYHPKKIIIFDQAESPLYILELELKERLKFYDFEMVVGNIANPERMQNIFEVFKPEIVFHAAAYKHVPIMEENPPEAIRANVIGTKIAADLSNKYGILRFIMVSTDKAVNPTNIMGASKRIAEIYIQSLNRTSSTNFITTRFGNVLGSNGSVIPRFRGQIEQGGPVTVTHPEVTRYFMTIPEACQLVLEASAIGQGGEIFVFNMGESVKIVDLAKKMIRMAGLTLGKDIRLNFTGLRPGEKLYEELFNNKENTIPTHHPKIMIAKVREYDDTISAEIDKLIALSQGYDNFAIVKLMKKIVPEYISQNSIFEQLDFKKEPAPGKMKS